MFKKRFFSGTKLGSITLFRGIFTEGNTLAYFWD